MRNLWLWPEGNNQLYTVTNIHLYFCQKSEMKFKYNKI